MPVIIRHVMRFRFLPNLLAVSLALLLIPIGAMAQSWAGTYLFNEDGGKSLGGTHIIVSHELTVLEADEGYYVTLKSNGYQTSRDLICNAKAEGNKLFIYFVSYGEENIFEMFKSGDLLLTLERKSAPAGQQVLTFWGKFLPVIPKNEKNGRVYFVRADEIKTND